MKQPYIKKQPIRSNKFELAPGMGKIPPQAIEIEEAILSNILTYPEGIDQYSKILTSEMFYKDAYQKIFQTALDMMEQKLSIDILTLGQELKKKGELDDVGGLYNLTLLANKFVEPYRQGAKTHALLIFEKYAKRELIRFSQECARNSFEDNTDISDLIEELRTEIEALDAKMEFNVIDSVSAVKETIKYIEDRASGLVLPFLKSGHEKFDTTFGLEQRQIIVIAGQKGHMKSKFTMDLLEGIDEHNDDIACLWYSMEEKASKLIRGKLSRELQIEDKRLTSKSTSKLNDEELTDIHRLSEEFMKQDIIYVEKTSSIEGIRANFKAFCKKRPDKLNILVVDNFGLINKPAIQNSNDADDYVSKKFVDIRDETNGLIIIVHHLSKAQLNRLNIENGYRPREEDVRGSARILDYSNSVILVNMPGKYKDLVQQEKEKNIHLEFNDDAPFPQNYIDMFLNINDEQDSNNEKTSRTKYLEHLHNTVSFMMSTRSLLKTFPNLNPDAAAKLIVNRYLAFYINLESINNSRQKQYKKNIPDPLTFLNNNTFLKNITINKESRDWYLYGEDTISLRKQIESLFIIDGVKIREGANDDDNVLIRYITDGAINKFKEI